MIAAAKILFPLGFVFCGAEASGGNCDDYHCGTDCYCVKYTDFETFENCFDEDFRQAELDAWKNTKGWISSLTYDGTSGYFKKDNIHIQVSCENREVFMHILDWENPLDANKAAELFRTDLGPCTTMDTHPADATSVDLFLKHWFNGNQ